MTATIDDLPGIKESELIKLGPCAVCGEPLLKDGATFYRVTLSHCAFDQRALSRRVGLGLMVGSDALARVFSPDDDLAKVVSGPAEVVVHERCAGKIGHLLVLMPEEK